MDWRGGCGSGWRQCALVLRGEGAAAWDKDKLLWPVCRYLSSSMGVKDDADVAKDAMLRRDSGFSSGEV